MAGTKERSGLFKFFYAIIQIVLLPWTFLKYVLKHPLWICCVVFIGFCLVIYYPLQQGKKLEDVFQWYKEKFVEIKLGAVSTLAKSGSGLVSEETLENINQIKQELAQDANDNVKIKGENFNKKIARDEVLNTKIKDIKKRGGFKRKGEAQKEMLREEIAATTGGGLATVLQPYQQENNEEDKKEDISQLAAEKEKVLEDKKDNQKPVVLEEAPDGKKAINTQDELDEFDLF